MSRLLWDQTGHKFYETGVRNAVLYRINESGVYTPGVAWNGLTGIDESPSGAEANSLYADDAKYLDLLSAEEYACTIKAYTYPDEFEECDGSANLISTIAGIKAGQQTRKPFGLCYRSAIGNDVDGEDHGYKLHLIYGLKASPSSKSRSTINNSPEAIEFSWEAKSTPVAGSGNFKPVSSVTIDSRYVDADELKAFEDVLYGTSDTEPKMPLPEELSTYFTKPVSVN